MLPRRKWLKTAVLSVLGSGVGYRLFAQQGNGSNLANRLDDRNIALLKDQLSKGLRAATPDQLKFVDLVVARVAQGKLPRAMVNLVYKWALERNPNVPFPYFQYALRALAKRRGVHI